MNVARPRHAAETDARIRHLIAECLENRHDLTHEQRATLTEDLLPTVWEAIRIKRPIWRPEDHNKKHAAYQHRINEDTRSKATHHAQPYTDAEIETLLRNDLTDEQIAEEIGRSFYAVKTKRKKLRAADRRNAT